MLSVNYFPPFADDQNKMHVIRYCFLPVPIIQNVFIGLTNPDGIACDTTEACNGELRWVDGEVFKGSKYPSLTGVLFIGGGEGKYPGAIFNLFGAVSFVTTQVPNTTRFVCEFTL